MKYITTRNQQPVYSFKEMFRQGIPEDGGFFVPEQMPQLSEKFLAELQALPFQQRAEKILSLFAADLSGTEVGAICAEAFSANFFDQETLYRCTKLNAYLENPTFLFLDFGPSASYQDLTQRFLFALLRRLALPDEKWIALAHESVASNKALAAVDFPQENIKPLFWVDRKAGDRFALKEIQHLRKQARAAKLSGQPTFYFSGRNADPDFTETVHPPAADEQTLKGQKPIGLPVTQADLNDLKSALTDFLSNQDPTEQIEIHSISAKQQDYLRAIEQLLRDQDFRSVLNAEQCYLMSMSSYNFAYYIALIIVLISAYLDLLEMDIIAPGEEFIFAFPNQNLDFLYLGVLLKELGLPISHLVVATNSNRTLIEFLKNGYFPGQSGRERKNSRTKKFKNNTPALDQTYFPNLERFVFEIVNRDSERSTQVMLDISQGKNENIKNILEDFSRFILAGHNGNKQVKAQISDWYLRSDYVFDPYTALTLAQINKLNSLDTKKAQILIPVLEHPLLSGQTVADAIFNKNQIAGKHYNQILLELAVESGLKIPYAALSDKDQPEIINLGSDELEAALKAQVLSTES